VRNLHYEKFTDGSVKCIEDEIPFELPEGWEWCNLSMIGQTNIGLTYKPSDKSLTGTMVLRSSNIVNGKIDLTDLVRVGCEIRDNQYALENDILICARNGSKSLVGKCAIIGNMNERASFGAFMAIYRTPYYRYVYHFLNSDFFREVFADGNSTAINQLTQDMIKKARIPFPPLMEQIRIADVVDKYLALIDEITEQSKECGQLVQNAKNHILDLAIRGKLVPQNPDDEPASVLLERIRAEKEELIKQGKIKRDKRESVIFRGEDNSYYEKDGEKVRCIDDLIPYDLPEGWIWLHGYSCFSGMETRRPSGTVFNYIDIDSIDNHAHAITEPKHLPVHEAPSRASRAVQAGSVLFSLVRPYLRNIAFVPEKYSDCIASTGFYICNSNGLLLPEYMYYLMLSPYVVDGLNRFMKGDNSPSISKDDIENWLFPVPPFAEQIRITSKIQHLITQTDNIESALA